MTQTDMHSYSMSSIVASAAIPLVDGYTSLIERIGNSEIVLIGEASHGTHEFYEVRAELTRRLIAEKDFNIVALEADWPDALQLNHYVSGRSDMKSANEALEGFRRFPTWMWRNTVMHQFVDWLKTWNSGYGKQNAVGIFGMDLYSMHTSMNSVIRYLSDVDPAAAKQAREHYSCFDHFGGDPQHYGYMTAMRGFENCEKEVVKQLIELRNRQFELLQKNGEKAEEKYFFAEQNAKVVINAERYYRSMYHGRNNSWNIRDMHMADTLEALKKHFGNVHGKMVVWAHNSHLGDARATEMSKRGECNVGQLMREKFGSRVFNVGFSTYTGTVTAARNWGDPVEKRRVRPGLVGSYEALFHDAVPNDFWLDLRDDGRLAYELLPERIQRAIGVIYRPETERESHYFMASLPSQFDVMVHIDKTRALEPLERISEWERDELPETYPTGF
jgi:erythromycin esterase-like protein